MNHGLKSRARICIAGLTLLLAMALSAGEKYIKVFLPDGTPITAELALTGSERQRGLMFRDRLDEDQGMLFIFESEEMNSFWMLNMKFPIDILWLDSNKRVVHIEAGVPPCPREPCPSYPTPSPALYVLELKSGIAMAHKVALRDRIDFILARPLK